MYCGISICDEEMVNRPILIFLSYKLILQIIRKWVWISRRFQTSTFHVFFWIRLLFYTSIVLDPICLITFILYSTYVPCPLHWETLSYFPSSFFCESVIQKCHLFESVSYLSIIGIILSLLFVTPSKLLRLLLELCLLMKRTRYMLFFYSKSNRPRILISSSDITLELSFISVELLFAKVAAAFLIE